MAITPKNKQAIATSKLVTPSQFVTPSQTYSDKVLSSSSVKDSLPAINTSPIIRKPPSSYVTKNCNTHVMFLNPEDRAEKPFYSIQKFFTAGNHFTQESPEKDRIFYEFILVDTESIAVSHIRDEKNQNFITYSKCKILKVLRLSDFCVDSIYSPISFSQGGFLPPFYNYVDYCEAWKNCFFFRNFNHSWFFYFERTCPKNFPVWFHSWFDTFGLIKDILPGSAQAGLDLYEKNYKGPAYHLKTLMFSAQFSVPWILTWDYDFTNHLEGLPRIIRVYKVKWWAQFNDIKRLSTKSVSDFFTQENRLANSKALASSSRQILPSSLSNREKRKKLLEDQRKLMDELSTIGSDSDDEPSHDLGGHDDFDPCAAFFGSK
jgi:hypothetical protein